MKTFLIPLTLFFLLTSFTYPELSMGSKGEWREVNCCGAKEIQSTLKNYVLKGVWGSSVEDVFVVGSRKHKTSSYIPNGIILHYDGEKWRIIRETRFYLNCVWGTSSNNVFVGGGGPKKSIILNYNGTEWSQMKFRSDPWKINHLGQRNMPTAVYDGGSRIGSIWGSSKDNVFAVASGGRGLIFHFDGQLWEKMYSGHYLKDISGNSKHNVYAIGNPKIIYYDGISWVSLMSGSYNSVWCSRYGVVFAGNDKGKILRFNSGSWDETDLDFSINDIYGIASNDVYAVGEKGFIFQFNGTTWHEMYSGIEQRLYAIWVNSPSEMYAVGDNGTILRFGKNHSSNRATEKESSEQISENEPETTYEIRLKDGRKIITQLHWEEGDSIYYYKFGTTIGLPKAGIEEIVVVE